MTTKRKASHATGRTGINYVRAVVEGQNCIFQEIAAENDIGNDAYIEFVQEEDATGCCIAVQIKSGPSYMSARADRYILKADRNHFEYWSSHALPIGAIIVDPKNGRAVWCDITEFLRANVERVAKGPYRIQIPATQTFDQHTFDEFRHHFLRYREEYGQATNFGIALTRFAERGDLDACRDSIHALFSFHRQRSASWYYLVSCFRNFRGHPLCRTLVLALSHVPGHPDILWHKDNFMDESVSEKAVAFMREHFGREEVLLLLEVFGESGFARGGIGQAVHGILDVVGGRNELLKSLAFDPAVTEDTQYWALLLLTYYTQRRSVATCREHIAEYLRRFPDTDNRELLVGVAQTLAEQGRFSFY